MKIVRNQPVVARLQTPFIFLELASVIMALSFSTWLAQFNNFAIEQAAFTGAEIGVFPNCLRRGMARI